MALGFVGSRAHPAASHVALLTESNVPCTTWAHNAEPNNIMAIGRSVAAWRAMRQESILGQHLEPIFTLLASKIAQLTLDSQKWPRAPIKAPCFAILADQVSGRLRRFWPCPAYAGVPKTHVIDRIEKPLPE